MKDFNDFLKYCSENADTVVFDTLNGSVDIPVDKRTITTEEWSLIAKTITKSNLALLRQYHKWLTEDQN